MPFALLQLRTWLTSRFDRADDRGASVVEYAMLLAMIAMVCLVAVNLIGEPVSEGLDAGGAGFVP